MRQHFGVITFNPDTRQLWRGRKEVHLSPKSFDLLALLVARRPAVVSKIEIREQLWPGTFVSETNLPALVAEIRAALGDDSRRPRFIRTLHGVGYAFLRQQPVERAGTTRTGGWLVGGAMRIPLYTGESILGREGPCVIVLDCERVSRRHARVTIDQDGKWIEDLRSKNGTYVNERRIAARVALFDGARVCLGSLMFTYRVAARAPETLTASSHERTAHLPRADR